MKKMYAIIYINPLGDSFVRLEEAEEMPNADKIARGAGTCLVFEYVDGDYSLNIKEEDILKHFKNYNQC